LTPARRAGSARKPTDGIFAALGAERFDVAMPGVRLTPPPKVIFEPAALPAIASEVQDEDIVDIAPLPLVMVDGVEMMESREIARLTKKRHGHVKTDIDKMLISLGKSAPPEFSGTVLRSGHKGSTRHVKVFNLPKRETMILVSGYSVELRARIVDRWMELEGAAKPPARAPAPSFGRDDARVSIITAKVDSTRLALVGASRHASRHEQTRNPTQRPDDRRTRCRRHRAAHR